MVECDRKKGREQFLQKHVANDKTRHNSGRSECGRSSASREDIKIVSKISIFTWMSIIFEKNHRGEKKEERDTATQRHFEVCLCVIISDAKQFVLVAKHVHELPRGKLN